MDIKTLKNFITIANAGSICKAASQLHISQPPLSKQIHLLEEELDTTLFERSPRGVTLTENGKVLYDHALSLIKYNDMIIKEIKNPASQTIRIGIISSAIQFAMNFMKDFNKNNSPAIPFEIVEKGTPKLLAALERGEIDLAIIRAPYEIYEAFQYEKLSDDYLIAAALPSVFKDTSKTITVSQLAEYPLITVPRWKDYINKSLNNINSEMSYQYICDDTRTALLMALNGMGVSILTGSLVAGVSSLEHLHIKQIEESLMEASLYVVYNPERKINSPTEKFLEYILKSV